MELGADIHVPQRMTLREFSSSAIIRSIFQGWITTKYHKLYIRVPVTSPSGVSTDGSKP